MLINAVSEPAQKHVLHNFQLLLDALRRYSKLIGVERVSHCHQPLTQNSITPWTFAGFFARNKINYKLQCSVGHDSRPCVKLILRHVWANTHMWIGQEARSESAYESEYEMKLNLTRVDSNRQKFVARLLSAVHVFSWLGAPGKCIYFTLFSTFIGILHFCWFCASQIRNGSCRQSAFLLLLKLQWNIFYKKFVQLSMELQ